MTPQTRRTALVEEGGPSEEVDCATSGADRSDADDDSRGHDEPDAELVASCDECPFPASWAVTVEVGSLREAIRFAARLMDDGRNFAIHIPDPAL